MLSLNYLMVNLNTHWLDREESELQFFFWFLWFGLVRLVLFGNILQILQSLSRYLPNCFVTPLVPTDLHGYEGYAELASCFKPLL